MAEQAATEEVGLATTEWPNAVRALDGCSAASWLLGKRSVVAQQTRSAAACSATAWRELVAISGVVLEF